MTRVVIFAASATVAASCDALASEPEGTVISSGPLRFEEFLLKDRFTYPYGIAAADLDADGDLDLTASECKGPDELYWFDNDGQGRFTLRYIQRNDPVRLERHAIGDLDHDGDLDVVIVKNYHGDLVWFENSGHVTDGKLWPRHVITKGKLPGAYDVVLADLDADGDLDVGASSWRLGNQFAWFENNGRPAVGPWKKYLIEEGVAVTRAVLAADFDGDGDTDLAGTASGANLVVWYENSGDPATQHWKRHVVNNNARCPMHGQAVDMDADGDPDLLLAQGYQAGRNPQGIQTRVVWYENNGKPAHGAWPPHVVCAPAVGAFEAVAGDLDADGDLDVVATAWSGPGRVEWFENGGDPKATWTKHAIKTDWPRAVQVILADFDADGRLDVAACAEKGSCELRWWHNLGPVAPED